MLKLKQRKNKPFGIKATVSFLERVAFLIQKITDTTGKVGKGRCDMSNFKVIETQEAFDEAIKERLKRERESVEAQYQDYDQIKAENQSLKEKMGASQSSLEAAQKERGTLSQTIEELSGKVKGFEMKELKTNVAMKYKIPYELASRLVGEDEESLSKDAEALASMLGHQEPVAPLKSTEPKIQGGEDGEYRNLLQSLQLDD